MKLDFQHNELKSIPHCLLQMPNLSGLNLSHNNLESLPDIGKWSQFLTVLNLSHNQLKSFPISVEAPSICSLNISHNNLREVPMCVCSFTTLHSLDLSNNVDILTLPVEMGRLSQIFVLNLENLKDLHDPPRTVQGKPKDCIRYLNSKLHGCKEFYRMKLMLVGCADRGKSTLVATLLGRKHRNESTVGVDVSEWQYKPGILTTKRSFSFSIWDFGGQEVYYATHQCFLSQRSLYLLLFNLKHGEKGVQELKPWLNNIALRAPKSCIIIVGTHLDEVREDERKRGTVERLQEMACNIVKEYNEQLNIVEIIPVALENQWENVTRLKNAIYNHAANYQYKGHPIMGQLIPASYHTLDAQLQKLQEQVRHGVRDPIMHYEEYKRMVQQMNLDDIRDEEELKTATLFLTDVGTLLHYDDCSNHLNKLYFIDPQWLCKMMAKVVTVKERNPFLKNGILHFDKIPLLFKDNEFPKQYFNEYMALLYHFEVVLPLDKTCVLITSMLPNKRPLYVDFEYEQEASFYSRHILFGTAKTPPGFWSRLISRIMHSVSRVSNSLDQNILHRNLIDSLSQNESVRPRKLTNSASQGSMTRKSSSLIQQVPLSTSFSKDDHCNCWENGFIYCDTQVSLRIESILGSKKFMRDKDGVLIVVSRNDTGMKILSQAVNLVVSLVREWYPGLMEGKTTCLDQTIPCYECVKMGRLSPFEFELVKCLCEIQEGDKDDSPSVVCEYDKDDPPINHRVAISDIAPDLLLKDIDAKFILDKSEELNASHQRMPPPSKKGCYDKVFKRKYREMWVTVKNFTNSKEGFYKFQSEIKFLQKSHHPCLICLVGVRVSPKMTLVMEETPNGSLEELLLDQQEPIHRITLFRMASQVAAALKFLHSTKILFRDLHAANVLWWTLDHKSICHCKLTNFGSATDLFPTGARGLLGTKGFTAPEVLYKGKRKEPSIYNHKADIFSFAMFIYQIIARKNPYYHIKPEGVDKAIQKGERPKLADKCSATLAYYYLIQLMHLCWEGNPDKRPSIDKIIQYLCQTSVQSVMSIHPIKGDATMKQACFVPSHQLADHSNSSTCGEIWICSNETDGMVISTYSLKKMEKIGSSAIRPSRFGCMCLCKNHMWIASRDGIKHNTLSIFSKMSRKKAEEIPQWPYMVSCITCSKTQVFLGTLDGLCFSFPIDIDSKQLEVSSKKQGRYISDSPINGILFTNNASSDCLWVSHTRYIYFLNPHSLALEEPSYPRPEDDYIGQLAVYSDESDTIWSAHVGGTILSAWDIDRRVNKCNIDTAKWMSDTLETVAVNDRIITAMSPALDTVWVGLASGHILVFGEQDLLTWYHPYEGYIRFITTIPCAGPCEKEECMVVTGAKNFRSLIPEQVLELNQDHQNTEAGILILWEAFSVKTMRQIKILEDKAPNLFDNHKSLRDIIMKENIEFKDGTHLLMEETLSVKLLDQQNVTLEIALRKPAKLTHLVDKLQRNAHLCEGQYRVEYQNCHSDEWIMIQTQEDLDVYIKLSKRPLLLVHTSH